jgi:hypothetical protein
MITLSEYVVSLSLVVIVSYLWGRLVGHNEGYHLAISNLQLVDNDEDDPNGL